MITKLYGFESDFKTSLKYGLQAITTSSASIELLKMYIDVIRPKIMEKDKDPLFITLTGSAIRVGRFVSSFFKRILGLNISTTTIRSIVATESSSLLSKGKISSDERDSVQHINGHTGITAQKYYQKRSRIKDTENVLVVHQKLLEENNNTEFDTTTFESDTTSPDTFEFDSTSPNKYNCPTTLEFETVSPVNVVSPVKLLSFDTENVRRVPWTEKEINIVGTWCKLYREQHPDNNNVVANCLRYIHSDNSIKKHFHPHHIADSTRLRWGWQKFQER